MDRSHHADVGIDRVVDDVHAHPGAVLRVAVSTGCCGGRLFSRCHLLLEPVVPRQAARAGDIPLHDSYPPLERSRGSTRRLAPWTRGRLGVRGWQWLFLVEGIPSILLSAAVLAFLTDRIDDARWLNAEQRAWLAASIARDRDGSAAAHDMPLLQGLLHPLIWLIGLIFFLLNTAGYSYTFWAPSVIRDALHTSDGATGLVIGAIACTTALAMLAVGVSSDRTGDRCLHTAACGIAGAVGFIGVAFVHIPAVQVGGLALVAAGFLAFYPVLFCLPPMLLEGSAAAAGIALVNAISNIGGFVGPWFVGALKDATGGLAGSFVVLAAFGVIAAVLCLVLRRQGVFAESAC